MKDNGKTINRMELEPKFGWITEAKENLSRIDMKVNGKMVNVTDSVFSTMLMARNMKDIGTKIKKVARLYLQMNWDNTRVVNS
jgi:hypothetical protein